MKQSVLKTLFTGSLVLVLVLCLAPLSCFADECTSDDYVAAYTECRGDNTRDLLYYKNPASDCEGGVAQPANVFNLPCDITCSSGYYLPYGALTCSPCDPGYFSLGGGTRVMDWVGFPTTGTSSNRLYFNTYAVTSTGTSLSTGKWQLAPNSTLYITSGPIGNSQSSILEVAVNLITSGLVGFMYKVDAEPLYDGLEFSIDGTVALTKKWTVLEYTTVAYNLTRGSHTLKWTYSKDMSLSSGSDSASLKFVEIHGLDYADDVCTACSPGTYNTLSTQMRCFLCPRNTFSNSSHSTSCTSCPSSYYSLEGSAKCSPRTNCTSSDYEAYYTPCELRDGQPVRDLKYRWLNSTTCNYLVATLPAETLGLPCGACNAGQYRPSGDYKCLWCPTGKAAPANSTSCSSCDVGSASVPGLFYNQWHEWTYLPGFTTTCTGSCGTTGWVLGGSYISSGTGHGRYVTSSLTLKIKQLQRGYLSFSFSFSCRLSYQCQLQFVDEGRTSSTLYSWSTSTQNYVSEVGNHTFRFVFVKQSTTNTATDRVMITSISLTGGVTMASEGGAKQCTTCSAGTYSPGGVQFCQNCSAGYSSPASASQCDPCPVNTFNPDIAGTCLPCGGGTTAPEGSTSCWNNCTFSPDGMTVFDLNGLKRVGDMYGPIYDQLKMSYYTNVCSLQHSNRSCYDRYGVPITGYACQVTNLCDNAGHCVGMNLGDVIGFYSGEQPTEGLIVSYTHGTAGCGGVRRSLNITFKCSPGSGIGYPTPPPINYIEGPPCQYNLVWETEYGCPICSSVHYSYYITACEDNQRQKVYYWLENPKRCHDGVSLPATETIYVNCSSTTTCNPGNYALETGGCEQCDAGTYSVGPGNTYFEFTSVPSDFTSSCTGTNCKGFVAQGGILVSTTGTSLMEFTSQFLMEGSVTFAYQVFANGLSSGDGSGIFEFSIDQAIVLSVKQTVFDYREFTAVLPVGPHILSWKFTGGATSSLNDNTLSSMAIASITVIGTEYSPLVCTPCHSGQHQSLKGQTECEICPSDTYAAGGAAECSPCSDDMYSFPDSATCEAKSICNSTDYQSYYSACSTDGTRSKYWVPLEPATCVNGYSPPATQTGLACAQCPDGMYRPEGEADCVGCRAGTYFDGASCVSAESGSYVLYSREYFVDQEQEELLPSGWSTTCYGHCGSSGWQVMSGYVSSGRHLAQYSVMSVLSYIGTFVTEGTVSFEFLRDFSDSAHGLQFFVNNIRMDLPTGNSRTDTASFSVAAGENELDWVYIQNPSTSSGKVSISDVIISGISTGSSSVEECPAGTYSGGAAVSCTRCPPGQYSSAPNSQTCTACSENFYAPYSGSTSCTPCPTGTYAPDQGSTKCETSCVFVARDGERTFTFNLTELKKTVGPVVDEDNSMYLINVCDWNISSTLCVDADGSPILTHVCERGITEEAAYSFGSLLEFSALSGDESSGFQLSFYGGDTSGCEDTLTERQTIINFECDVNEGEGTPRYIYSPGSDECAASFYWQSVYACPVCTDSDYYMFETGCQGGEKQTQLIRSADCNGPETILLGTSKCRDVALPLGVVFGVGVFVIILIVVIVIILVKHKQIRTRYYKLVNQNVPSVDMPEINNTETQAT